MAFPIIAAAISGIVSVVSSIGPAVANFCTQVLPKIVPVLQKGIEFLKDIANVATQVGQVFGIFNKDETAENLGDRAIQAAEKNGTTLDQFDDFDDYLDALRRFEFNPEQSEKIPLAQKIVAGLALAGRGLDEKLNTPEGTMGNLWPLVGAKPDYFTADKITAYLKLGQDVMSVVDYFEGKLGAGEALEVEDKLIELDKSAAPEKTDSAILADLCAAAAAVQSQVG